MSTKHQSFVGCIIFCIALCITLFIALPQASFAFEATSPVKITESATATTSAQTTATTTVSTSTLSAHKLTPSEIEKLVRQQFVDMPAMIDIARCESKFRQYTDAGNVLRGGWGSSMIGVFQFSERVHATKAKSLGFDIYTPEGNLQYAAYVYGKSGTDPWISSFSCWKGAQATPALSENTSTLTSDLHFGQTHAQVRLLQQLLNKKGYVIASSGPGSKGNETTLFGNLTRTAVRSFQCAQKIACAGDEYSMGYGLVNEKTRTALLSSKTATTVSQNSQNRQGMDKAGMQKKIAELMKLVAELQKQLAHTQES